MLTTIDSVKRAARKGEIVSLTGLNETDKRKVLKDSGFPTNAGTMYVPGFDGKSHYIKHVKL
jgi:hypothetical protein